MIHLAPHGQPAQLGVWVGRWAKACGTKGSGCSFHFISTPCRPRLSRHRDWMGSTEDTGWYGTRNKAAGQRERRPGSWAGSKAGKLRVHGFAHCFLSIPVGAVLYDRNLCLSTWQWVRAGILKTPSLLEPSLPLAGEGKQGR